MLQFLTEAHLFKWYNQLIGMYPKRLLVVGSCLKPD